MRLRPVLVLLCLAGALVWLGIRPWSATSTRVESWKPSATEVPVSQPPDDVVLQQRVQCDGILRSQPEHPTFLPPLQFFATVGYAGWDAETTETYPCTDGLVAKRLTWALGAIALVVGGWLVLRARPARPGIVSNVSTQVDESRERVNPG